jgi:hypothetical protein
MGKKQIENERTSSNGGDFYFLPREIPVAGVGATAKVLPDGGETSTESTREDVVAGEKDVFVEIEVSKSIRGHSLQGLGQEEQQQKQQKRDSGDATKDEFGPKPVNRNLVRTAVGHLRSIDACCFIAIDRRTKDFPSSADPYSPTLDHLLTGHVTGPRAII